jgi:hypothetical protein
MPIALSRMYYPFAFEFYRHQFLYEKAGSIYLHMPTSPLSTYISTYLPQHTYHRILSMKLE